MTDTAQQTAQETIQTNVLKYCYMLIESLKDNYREYAIRGHQRYVGKPEDSHGYHTKQVEQLKNGIMPIDYEVVTGKKYHKIVFVDAGASRSVHCFVDKKTGEVYKSASWKAPAQGVRYDMRLIEDRERILANCDWSGGYLYTV